MNDGRHPWSGRDLKLDIQLCRGEVLDGETLAWIERRARVAELEMLMVSWNPDNSENK